jgi:cystathionine beta-synthase
MLGYSSGSALQAVFQLKDRFAPGDVVVALFPDHGSRYLGKVYNDDWMEEQGFLKNSPSTEIPVPQVVEKIEKITAPTSQNPAPGPASGAMPGAAAIYPYSYEAMKKRYQTYYRTYRIKYKKYLRQTKDTFKLLGPGE